MVEAGREGELTGARGAALPSRVMAELPTKLTVLLGLAVGICVPYFFLQRFPVFPVRSVPQTPLDAWVSFDPGWVYAYGSIALLVPLLPLLAAQREQLLRYSKGLALLCVMSFAVFLLFPVAGPRPIWVPDHATYQLLISGDTPLNSMPSLHAGLVAYSFLFGGRILRDALRGPERAAYTLLGVLWGTAILYATLATKQHWALDLPPGLLAAWLAHRWAWRGAR